MSAKIYEMVTDKIIKALESGTVPWKKEWSGNSMVPAQNLISRKPYRGINALMTNFSAFNSPYWVTFKQALDLGGCVRKGEKGTPIVFWKKIEDADKDKDFMFASYFTVFNIEQVDGIPESKIPVSEKISTIVFNPIVACEMVVSTYPNCPSIEYVQQKAFYKPSMDYVNMPKKETFTMPETYYATLFHELVHSTGHVSRLKREGITDLNYFGSHEYSKEELIAEMGAAFLCAETGIGTVTIENSASYIAGWLKRLKGDSKLVMQAASAAQKAVDHIMNRKIEYTKNETKVAEVQS